MSDEISSGDIELIKAVDDHLGRCFGKEGRWVMDELVSPTIHLDVHVIPPSADLPLLRLVTSGVAERPMTVPAGFDESPFAELTIALPPGWPMTKEAWRDERAYWPIRLLKSLGRLPHEQSTFLWHGHTISNANPPQPYAPDTKLCCALIASPLMAPEGFSAFEVGGRTVRILAVIPIYQDELELKIDRGTDALYDLFAEHELTDVIDPRRPSVVRGKRGLFGR